MSNATKTPYKGAYLLNSSGQLIKPMNEEHYLKLLATESRWTIDPSTGQPKQIGGFRVPTQEEIDAIHEAEAAKQAVMEKQEYERKKKDAQIVMIAPDVATMDRVNEARGRKAKD